MFYVSYYYAVSGKLYLEFSNHNLMICLIRTFQVFFLTDILNYKLLSQESSN